MSTSGSGLVSGGTQLIAGTSYTSGQGINVSATVSAVISAKRAPATNWQNQQTMITSQVAELKSLQTEMSSLQSAFQNLNDFSGIFSAMNATSSNTTQVSASATSTAVKGSYNVVVNTLASTGASYSNEQASSTISAGALVYSIGGGAAQTIDIPEGTNGSGTTTLSAAATYINQQNLGISASVITDALGSRLVLSATGSGAAASVSVQSAPSGLNFTNVPGTDASLTINGVPIASATNEISTVIHGVTLYLTGPTSSAGVSVQVGTDNSQVVSAVNSFITAYNAVITDLNGQFQYNASLANGTATTANSTDGVLQNDSTARVLQQQLLSIISAAGSDSASSAFNSLAKAGIDMNNDGTLTLNSTALQNALLSNYGDIKAFFQSGGASTFAAKFKGMMMNLNNSADGAIALDIKGLQSNYTALQKNINDLETQLTDLQTTLTNKYAALNTSLQLYPTKLLQIETLLGYRATTNNGSNG